MGGNNAKLQTPTYWRKNNLFHFQVQDSDGKAAYYYAEVREGGREGGEGRGGEEGGCL
jgi:hypothetical protein